MLELRRSDTYSRRIRFVYGLLLLLFLVSWISDQMFSRAEIPWYRWVSGVVMGIFVTIMALSSFIRVTDAGLVSYLGMGKLESTWQNVEGVRDIVIGGRKVRCIVLKAPGSLSGWYWKEEWSVPREYRNRLIPIPESGPMSYHGSAHLINEIGLRLS